MDQELILFLPQQEVTHLIKQIKRITQLCQSQLPQALEARLIQVQDDPDAVRQVGVEWAQRQIGELLERGAKGVHIYALNKAKSAIELINSARSYPY